MIRHIVAFDRHRGIAKQGIQPWKLPTDERYFSAETKKHGGIVLMGRKTYEVIGQPLPDRQNFILTRDQSYEAAGAVIIHDLEAFLAEHQDVWVIGGVEVYELTLQRAGELYISQIEADFDCDTFYPEFAVDFELTRSSQEITENDLTFRFDVYTPKKR